jgi:hypothetical protein
MDGRAFLVAECAANDAIDDGYPRPREQLRFLLARLAGVDVLATKKFAPWLAVFFRNQLVITIPCHLEIAPLSNSRTEPGFVRPAKYE